MQANVDEVARHVLEERPAARRVGDDERDVVLAQYADELGRREARVPHLERVAQLAIFGRTQIRAAGDACVVPAG